MPKKEYSLAVQLRVNERAQQGGNKAANLQELAELCPLLVPAFYVVDDQKIKDHLNQYAPEWQRIWADFQLEQGEEKAELKEAAKAILATLRHLIQKTFIEYPIEKPELLQFLETMQTEKAMVFARSTGNGEDTVDAANPGGNESFGNISPDFRAVSIAMGKVCASYFSEKSLMQRLLSPQNDITQDAFMPVLMQRMIGEPVHGFRYSHHIVRSGVMYTGDDLTRIQVAPGLGELVVNSKGAFDTFYVTRETVVYPEIARKPYRLVPVEQGVRFIKNPKALQESASLPPAKVLQLSALGHKIEQHYGLPMDVEFVYDPLSDAIHLVQARPITPGEAGIITPSSIPPSKIPALKQALQKGGIQKQSAMIIAPAGFEAKIITNPEQILLCESIGMALDLYLAQKNSPLRAVVVRNRPPSSSHEAAQFNSKAIVVVQVDDLKPVHEWISREQFTLLVDPQRNQLLDLSLMVEQPEHAKLELEQTGFLEQGLFTLPVTPITTFPTVSARKGLLNDLPSFPNVPRDVAYFIEAQSRLQASPLIGDLMRDDQKTALSLLFSKLNPDLPMESNNKYTLCLYQLDLIEAASVQQSNHEALMALNRLRIIFYRLTKAEQGMKEIFQQVMVVCEEIERSLVRYTQATADEKELREEHLSLVAKLKSLISYQGHSDIFSGSLWQVMQEKKSLKLVQGIERKQFSLEQSDYLAQFLKLSKIAFNAETQHYWTQFAVHCVGNRESIQKLATLIKFYIEHHMESQFINQDFRLVLGKGLPMNEVLDCLYETCIKTKQELATIQIDEKRNTIQAWERRIQEWSKPEQFDALLRDFEKEIVPLVNQIRLDYPCDLIVLPSLPAQDVLKDIPGEANWVIVVTRDKQVYMVDKAKQQYEEMDRFPTKILSLFQSYFHLRLEENRPHSLASSELDYIISRLEYDHMSQLSIHIRSEVLNRTEMFELVQTDLAYIISDNKLYFINKLRGTCALSQMSLEEQAAFKRTLKMAMGKGKTSVVSSFQTLQNWSAYSRDRILKDYDFIATGFNALAQKAILSLAFDLADLMDKIIKSTKSSPDDAEKDKLLLVRRFFTLLKPYHALMQNWVSIIPDHKFTEWATEIGFHNSASNGKCGMLHLISQALEFKRDKLEEKELHPSGAMSIAALKLGSTGSFSRQFDLREITLEDLFSLMHQNLLSAIAVLNRAGEIPVEYLPEALRPLFQTFQQGGQGGGSSKLELLNMSHSYPHLNFEYNLPLRNHSARFTIIYNQQSQQIIFHGHIFGRELGYRMEVIADLIRAEGPLFHFDIKKEPSFSNRAQAIEFTWAFHANRLPDIASTLLEAIQDYGGLTYGADDCADMRENYQVHLFHVKRRHSKVRLSEEKQEAVSVQEQASGTSNHFGFFPLAGADDKSSAVASLSLT